MARKDTMTAAALNELPAAGAVQPAIPARIQALRQQHAQAVQELARLDHQRAQLQATVLRLEGGIGALEEWAAIERQTEL